MIASVRGGAGISYTSDVSKVASGGETWNERALHVFFPRFHKNVKVFLTAFGSNSLGIILLVKLWITYYT